MYITTPYGATVSVSSLNPRASRSRGSELSFKLSRSVIINCAHHRHFHAPQTGQGQTPIILTVFRQSHSLQIMILSHFRKLEKIPRPMMSVAFAHMRGECPGG